MTECERLIANGTFTRDFFKPEVRCDFLVDEKRKKIWAIELDLAIQLDRLCRKYGLKYYLMYGSLLGAVRHHGFIPWDDDFDVAMLRSDYDALLTHADEFGLPYEFQSAGRTGGYHFGFSRLRNVQTTGAQKKFVYQEFTQGIFIDVHPFDDVLNDEDDARYEELKKLCTNNATAMRLTNPSLSAADIRRVREYDGADPCVTDAEISRLSRIHNGQGAVKVANVAFSCYSWDRSVFSKSAFTGTEKVAFEGNFRFPVLDNAENVLATMYGDWNCFPPVEQRGCWHDDFIFEPDVPYSLYKTSTVK